MEIVERFTWEQMKAILELPWKPTMIFYSARTCWWTHDRSHLSKLPHTGLPCDPRGGVLYQTDDVAGFLATAEQNSAHYGRHGLRAFMAAHHLNCIVGNGSTRPTCGDTWDEYNDAIDRLLDEKKDKAHP